MYFSFLLNFILEMILGVWFRTYDYYIQFFLIHTKFWIKLVATWHTNLIVFYHITISYIFVFSFNATFEMLKWCKMWGISHNTPRMKMHKNLKYKNHIGFLMVLGSKLIIKNYRTKNAHKTRNKVGDPIISNLFWPSNTYLCLKRKTRLILNLKNNNHTNISHEYEWKKIGWICYFTEKN